MRRSHTNPHIIPITLAAFALALGVALFVIKRTMPEPSEESLRELSRSQLELRDGQLFAIGDAEPFDGTLVERYSASQKRIAIGIRGGKPHGVSRGWYENGQLEVEEHFVAGISHGKRTRWYPNGTQKSRAEIVDGEIVGTFTRWHDNGQKAAEIPMRAGKPHGESRSWDRGGSGKIPVMVDMGEVAGSAEQIGI